MGRIYENIFNLDGKIMIQRRSKHLYTMLKTTKKSLKTFSYYMKCSMQGHKVTYEENIFKAQIRETNTK